MEALGFPNRTTFLHQKLPSQSLLLLIFLVHCAVQIVLRGTAACFLGCFENCNSRNRLLVLLQQSQHKISRRNICLKQISVQNLWSPMSELKHAIFLLAELQEQTPNLIWHSFRCCPSRSSWQSLWGRFRRCQQTKSHPPEVEEPPSAAFHTELASINVSGWKSINEITWNRNHMSDCSSIHSFNCNNDLQQLRPGGLDTDVQLRGGKVVWRL